MLFLCLCQSKITGICLKRYLIVFEAQDTMHPACKMSAHTVPAHLVSISISVIRHYANFEEKKGNRKASVTVICSSSVVLMVMQPNKLNLILGNEYALNAVVWIKKSPDRF